MTGIPSLYYPRWKRQIRYLFSLLVTIPILSLGVLVMILSLNLNGYIKDKNSPIHVSYLATFAEPVSVHTIHIRVMQLMSNTLPINLVPFYKIYYLLGK